MKDQKIYTTFGEADALLQFAQNEIQKAEEDVVPFMICSNARQSIIKFLHGYLKKHGENHKKEIVIENLLNRCSKINPIFSEVSLKNMECSHGAQGEPFCTDLEKVGNCVQFAEEIKNLVSQDTWPLSKRVK